MESMKSCKEKATFSILSFETKFLVNFSNFLLTILK